MNLNNNSIDVNSHTTPQVIIKVSMVKLTFLVPASTISTTEYSTRVQTLTPEVSSTRVRKTTTEEYITSDTPTTQGRTIASGPVTQSLFKIILII